MARPLTPLLPVGAPIWVVGTLSDYQTKPFSFRMIKAELADESLPIAGGACADPRPEMCTREYRATCGVRRDGTRHNYGNACHRLLGLRCRQPGAGALPVNGYRLGNTRGQGIGGGEIGSGGPSSAA